MERTEYSAAGRSPRQPPGVVEDPPNAAAAAPASKSGAAALRAALQSQLHAQLLEQSPDGHLRQTVRLICEETRRQQLQVEHVIVMLKQAWYSLPEVRQLPSRSIAADLLSAVVALTIEEFYAERG